MWLPNLRQCCGNIFSLYDNFINDLLHALVVVNLPDKVISLPTSLHFQDITFKHKKKYSPSVLQLSFIAQIPLALMRQTWGKVWVLKLFFWGGFYFLLNIHYSLQLVYLHTNVEPDLNLNSNNMLKQHWSQWYVHLFVQLYLLEKKRKWNVVRLLL